MRRGWQNSLGRTGSPWWKYQGMKFSVRMRNHHWISMNPNPLKQTSVLNRLLLSEVLITSSISPKVLNLHHFLAPTLRACFVYIGIKHCDRMPTNNNFLNRSMSTDGYDVVTKKTMNTKNEQTCFGPHVFSMNVLTRTPLSSPLGSWTLGYFGCWPQQVVWRKLILIPTVFHGQACCVGARTTSATCCGGCCSEPPGMVTNAMQFYF